MIPSVPELPADCDVLHAALAYVAAGWYVLPIDPAGKHAGSVLGKRWQDQSSRDPQQVAAWFIGTNYGLALHVGRSGAVAFDVDHPELLPTVLAEAIAAQVPPHQSTRAAAPGRGHYLFSAAAGSVGNAGGDLGTNWGEVRGLNGIIVVQPTPHEKAADGGRYAWVRAGALPGLPNDLAASLRPPAAPSVAAADPAVHEFLAALPAGGPCPAVAVVPLTMPETGRHSVMNERVLRLARLGDQGHRGAFGALAQLRQAFITAVSGDRRGGDTEAANEFLRSLAGAIGGVLAQPTTETDKGCCTPDLPDVSFEWAGGEGGVGGLTGPLATRLLSPAQVRVLPPPELVVDGLLTMDSESWLIAAAGSYKTFVALDLAGHIALGKPWMGRRVRQGPVLYLLAEGIGGLGKRVRAWEQRNGPMDSEHMYFLTVPVQAGEPEQWDALVDLCRQLRPVLVVLDTQARLTVGMKENDNTEMGQWVHAVGRLRRATGGCVLVVHHLGRSGQDARGASAIDGAQDSELKIVRTADKRVVLETDKQRHLPDDVRVELELFECELDDGTTSLVVGPPISAAPTLAPWREGLTDNQALIMGILHEQFSERGGTQQQVHQVLKERGQRGEAKYSKSSFHLAWNTLLKKDKIERVHGTERFVLAVTDNEDA